MQLGFWATPIVWNLDMISTHHTISRVIKSMPFSYLVTAMRESFMPSENIITAGHGIYSAIFWIVTIFMFIWGNYIFRKSKKDFADVL